MESMASWFVGMRSSYLIQWMMDLISLNQAQWKNGIRMVLDKVRLISIIIWYKEVLSYSYVDITKRTVARRWVSLFLIVHTKETKCARVVKYLTKMFCYGYGFIFRVIGLRWSLIMGGGARFGVMGLCWIIVEEHTLGLVSLNQVQRIYGTMKCIRFVSLVKLQDGSGYVRSTVFHYLKLSRTRSTHTVLMFFDVMI